jgi:hypothetical protein
MAEAGILGSDKQYAHQELARTELGAERMARISLAAASVEASRATLPGERGYADKAALIGYRNL